MPATSKGTIHDPSWRAFAAWCRRLRLRPLPAHPWTVAAFLRWCEERPGAATVQDAVGAIAAVHVRRHMARPERDAIVRRTLEALDKRRRILNPRASAVANAVVPRNPKAPEHPAGAKPRQPRRTLRSSPKLSLRRRYRSQPAH
ncbi:MAG: hypothetical protein FJX42_01780 [Alphaproteobacteria bacterium]|nr:hypothetical protein [Alphaproteobacteria bacterium]